MSEWPMRGHFRYLRFKTFLMTLRTPQWEVFWALLLSSEHSGVPEDSQPPTFPSVGLHPHTWPKWGCDTLLANLFSLCAFYWEYEFFLECVLEYVPLDVMAIVSIFANCPYGGLLQNLNRNGIELFTRTCLSFRLSKVISLQCFLIIFFIFSNCFKSFLTLGYRRGFLRRRGINWRRKRGTSFQRPRLQRQNVCKFMLLLQSLLLLFQLL